MKSPIVIAVILLCVWLGADPAHSQTPREPSTAAVTEVFAARLAELRPSDPAAYLALAEDLLPLPTTPASRDLVVQLLVLAYELDRTDGGQNQTAASAAIALASLPTARHSRDWLFATAKRLDPRHSTPRWLALEEAETEQSNGYQIAVGMGFVRSGWGSLAKQVFDRPDVAASLEAFDRTLKMMGITGGADGLRREAERWPCRECSNERIVRRSNGSTAEYRICPNCGGLPGPRLTPGEFVAHLRSESLLLSGHPRSWAAQIASDGGAALLDPDPASLAEMFRVDASRSLFRDGRWVAVLPARAPANPETDSGAGDDKK